MFVTSVSFCLIVMLSVMEVHSQVCLKQTIVTKKVMGTYSKSERQYYGFTVKTRLRTRIIERWETHTQLKDIKVCCDGYKKKYYNIEVRAENCEPICKSNCTNGYCKYPEVCWCNAGYTQRKDTCEPVCEGGCLHGACVAPNTCRCDPGYKLVENTCHPICTEPCENGTCISPDTCECNHGYYKPKNSITSCKPHCPGGCPLNGYCDAPGKCKCNSGWRFSENYSNRCVAVCQNPCGNGTCILPNYCFCALGFQKNTRKRLGLEVGEVCEPINWARTSPRNNAESTTTYDSYTPMTTTVSYSMGSSSVTGTVDDDDVNTSVTAEYNETITNVAPTELMDKTWMQRHGMFIWIPLILIVTAGILSLLFWRRTPVIIINFFKRRSYNVQGAYLKRNAADSFESLQFITDEFPPTRS